MSDGPGGGGAIDDITKQREQVARVAKSAFDRLSADADVPRVVATSSPADATLKRRRLCLALSVLLLVAVVVFFVATDRGKRSGGGDAVGGVEAITVVETSRDSATADPGERLTKRAPPPTTRTPPRLVTLRGVGLRVTAVDVRDATPPEGCTTLPVCSTHPTVDYLAVRCVWPSACPALPPSFVTAAVTVQTASPVAYAVLRCISGCNRPAADEAKPSFLPPGGEDGGVANVTIVTQVLQLSMSTLNIFDVAVLFGGNTSSAFGVATTNFWEDHPMCFASVGDWGSTSLNWKRVAATMTAFIRDHTEVKFFVSTGDNFYPTGVRSVHDAQWVSTFETPLGDPVLQGMRFFVIAGNHDQWGLAPQLEYGKTHPRWYFPARSYGIRDIPVMPSRGREPNVTVAIFALDTYGRDLPRQLKDMTAFFSEPVQSREWRVVLGHTPVYSGSNHGQKTTTAKFRDVIKPLLLASGVHAYINGDDHVLEILRDSDATWPVDYFVSGGGGGSASYTSIKLTQTVFNMAFPRPGLLGFMVHCLGRDSMVTRIVDDAGSVAFTHTTSFGRRAMGEALP